MHLNVIESFSFHFPVPYRIAEFIFSEPIPIIIRNSNLIKKTFMIYSKCLNLVEIKEHVKFPKKLLRLCKIKH